MGTLISLLKKLKRSVRGRRWIVKRKADSSIKEVKCIFKPEEYEKQKGARPMIGDKALLKVLIKEKEKNEI
tara:strand:- start:561 stop:773 length:213 start_codon:yes stop_codon:yes gene_type:complete